LIRFVTLNLTLLTRDAIHQSADYRLFDLQATRVVDTPSTKKLSLQYLRWSGSVTYAGIGALCSVARTRPTSLRGGW
jgi:hypothetical protein